MNHTLRTLVKSMGNERAIESRNVLPKSYILAPLSCQITTGPNTDRLHTGLQVLLSSTSEIIDMINSHSGSYDTSTSFVTSIKTYLRSSNTISPPTTGTAVQLPRSFHYIRFLFRRSIFKVVHPVFP